MSTTSCITVGGLYVTIGLLLFLGHVFGCFYFFSTKDWWSDSEKGRLGEEDTIYSQFGVTPEDHGVWTRHSGQRGMPRR